MIKKLIIPTYVFILIGINTAIAQNLTKSQVINIVSKQSMLVERMAKAKITKNNNVNDPSIDFEINSSIILFEKNLNFLAEKNYNPAYKTNVYGLKLLWAGFKKTILREDENTYIDILRFNEIILNECNSLFLDLLKLSKKDKSYPYNSSSNEFTSAVVNNYDIKYLSQQLSLYYSAYYYRVEKYNNQKFVDIIDNLDLRMMETTALRNIDSDIVAKADDLENEWTNIKNLLKSVLDNKFISTHSSPSPKAILDSCNIILKKSDLLSRAYKASQST